MKRMRRVWYVLSIVLLLAAGGCVELAGQRIVFFHDEAADEIKMLLFYDGVHASENDPDGSTAKGQIPEFVQGGDIMLLDWPLHIRMDELRRTAGNAAESPALRALAARAAATAKVSVLGRYRDPLGRMGAAQLVRITDAQAFIHAVNSALSEWLLAELDNPPGDNEFRRMMPRTCERLRAAAKKGFDWIALKGHAIAFSFPADPLEWRVLKAGVVQEMIAQMAGRKPSQAASWPSFLVQLYSVGPIAYDESDRKVTLRIGDPKRPTTLRFHMRDRYTRDLEGAIVEHAPADVDALRIAEIFDEAAAPEDPGMKFLMENGPPEEKVRAVLAAYVQSQAEERKPVARAWLEKWAVEWNREHGVPAAPASAPEAADIDAWTRWYGSMLKFPLPSAFADS